MCTGKKKKRRSGGAARKVRMDDRMAASSYLQLLACPGAGTSNLDWFTGQRIVAGSCLDFLKFRGEVH